MVDGTLSYKNQGKRLVTNENPYSNDYRIIQSHIGNNIKNEQNYIRTHMTYIKPATRRIQVANKFVIFIKNPGFINIHSGNGKMVQIPDGSNIVAQIWNKLPEALKKDVLVYNIQEHPSYPPDVDGVPQMYNATNGENGVYYKNGKETIATFLYMIRMHGLNIRASDLSPHPMIGNIDIFVDKLVSIAVKNNDRSKTARPGDPEFVYVDENLKHWKTNIIQTDKCPYDPQLKIDDGDGNFLEAAPTMTDHLDSSSFINVFGESDTGPDNMSKFGASIDVYSDHNSQLIKQLDIEAEKFGNVRKLTDDDINRAAQDRDKHLLKLHNMLGKNRPESKHKSTKFESYSIGGIKT